MFTPSCVVGCPQAVFGDMGYGVDGNAVETRAQLDRAAGDYDWVLHVGDISYADDYFLHDPFKFGYEQVYDNYMNWMQNVTAVKVSVLPSLGGQRAIACQL